MFWGNFHALALLLTLFIVARVVRFSPRRPIFGRTVGAMLLGLVSSFVSLSISVHLCDSGAPVTQWAVPNLGVVALLALARPSRLRSVTLAALVVGSVGLSLHYSELVHEPGYIGHPQPSRYDRVSVITPFWHSPLTGLYEQTELAVPRPAPPPGEEP